MLGDVRYALRQVFKAPAFSIAAIVTLALGIGAAAAMLTLIKGVLLSPPPYADPDRLVFLTQSRQDGQPYLQGATVGQWLDWRSSAKTIETPAVYRWTFNFLVLPDGSRSIGGLVVSNDFFRVLGVQPMLGREFLPDEASRPGAPATATQPARQGVPPTAVIIGYALWERQYQRDPNIIGKSLQISRMPAPLPIVGVMPAGIRFLPDPAAASEPNYDLNAPVDYFLPYAPDETQPRGRGLNVISRLHDGVDLQQAQNEMVSFTTRQVQADSRLEGLTVSVRPMLDVLNREGRSLLLPLFGFVVLVFFVACINVAGLFVARGVQRHREYAMRTALGASRGRLFGQTIVESAALGMFAVILGAVFAFGIVSVFKAIGDRAIPHADDVQIGWQVIAFGFVAGLIAAVMAGVVPAARAASPGHANALKGIRSTTGRAERRLLGAIATVQIVLTVALLTGATLLIRTSVKLASINPGYDIDNIMAVTVTTVSPNSFLPFHTQALERVAELPGVSHAAFAWGVPLTGNKWPGTLEVVGRPDLGQVSLPLRSVTAGYFALMDIDIVSGRAFTNDDSEKAPRVMIVNQSLANRYFSGDAVGRQLRFPGTKPLDVSIVGVIADTRTDALSDEPAPEVYLPFWQNGAFSKHLVVRTSSQATGLFELVRREVHAVDPTASVERATTMTQIRSESVANRTFAMRLLIGFSLAATALALVGIYGVLSLSVGSRLKEIAVRKAIGAQQQDILRSVVGEGGRMILAGVIVGAVVAAATGRALESLLFGVPSTDAISIVAAAGGFGLIALLACLIPALRAARTDLVAALHQD
jgi:putative ABC transport system permease protein